MSDRTSDWLSVKEAAAIMGYSAPYFRELFCAADAPMVTMRVKRCPSGRRRILVSRESVEGLVRGETVSPGGAGAATIGGPP
jgi:hypothetical protein